MTKGRGQERAYARPSRRAICDELVSKERNSHQYRVLSENTEQGTHLLGGGEYEDKVRARR